jgi:hypothetical protein
MKTREERTAFAATTLTDLERMVTSKQMSISAALAWAFLRGGEYQRACDGILPVKVDE